jgi:hypothetical protein
MIAASAIEAGCDALWSDDMQLGKTREEGLRIVSPFRVALQRLPVRGQRRRTVELNARWSHQTVWYQALHRQVWQK